MLNFSLIKLKGVTGDKMVGYVLGRRRAERVAGPKE